MPKYELTEQEEHRLDNDFTHHAVKPGQLDRYVEIRSKTKELARIYYENCPRSRELSHALTLLEDAAMNANAAIARNE
jgi:hypothetical protein